MKRAQLNIAALTLPVRPQCQKKLSAMEHKRKSHLQMSRKSSKERTGRNNPFKIVIESILSYGYYPNSNIGKSR